MCPYLLFMFDFAYKLFLLSVLKFLNLFYIILELKWNPD